MSTSKEQGIEGGQLKLLVDRITGLVEEAGLTENFILMVNEKEIYKGLTPPKVKPVGNLSVKVMTEIYCECGCRLNTDKTYYWCSNPRCDFIGQDEVF
jgi:hypothetical protein